MDKETEALLAEFVRGGEMIYENARQLNTEAGILREKVLSAAHFACTSSAMKNAASSRCWVGMR